MYIYCVCPTARMTLSRVVHSEQPDELLQVNAFKKKKKRERLKTAKKRGPKRSAEAAVANYSVCTRKNGVGQQL